MPQEWTVAVMAQLHRNQLTIKQLAAEAGYTPEYLSMVLNGHRDPEKGRTNILAALGRLTGESISADTPQPVR